MLEIGQIFNKDGFEYCVLELLEFNGKKYALFSREKDKISYIYFEISDTDYGVELLEVKDDNINNALIDISKEDFNFE